MCASKVFTLSVIGLVEFQHGVFFTAWMSCLLVETLSCCYWRDYRVMILQRDQSAVHSTLDHSHELWQRRCCTETHISLMWNSQTTVQCVTLLVVHAGNDGDECTGTVCVDLSCREETWRQWMFVGAERVTWHVSRLHTQLSTRPAAVSQCVETVSFMWQIAVAVTIHILEKPFGKYYLKIFEVV